MAGSAGFVGRERELSRLLGALSGEARLLLVVGDAGVGKTRFVGEGFRRAAAGRMLGLSGGCLPLAEKLPLLPVTDALNELGRLNDGRLLETALGTVPQYVRAEIGRLVPQLGTADERGGARGEGWQRERLFAGVAELLGAVARRSAVGLVIEDVHWADSATLDCLTYLSRAAWGNALTVVVTCRSDEVRLDSWVSDWLAHVRGSRGLEEIRLGPLSRAEVSEQIAGLMGGSPPGQLIDDLYTRAEGNPFFTEQLVASLIDSAEGARGVSDALPARLVELLAAQAGRCGGGARALLAALAVAGRPLTEVLLCGITGLDLDTALGALRELASARLLAESTPGGAHRPRHALLAEVVAAGLLPGDRAALHERTARALEAAGDGTLAAEVAGHWAAAGCLAEEMPTRVAAAEAAGRVFAYAEAALHWLRAIELCQAVAAPDGVDVPRMYVLAIDALKISGDAVRAEEVAEEAYRRFANHLDPQTAAVIHQRTAYFRAIETPDDGLPVIVEALRLFEQAPPSADHAEAWLDYGALFLFHAEGRRDASHAAFSRALEIADRAGATALLPRLLPWLALHAFLHGQVEEGFAILRRARRAAESSPDREATLWVAASESDAWLKTGNFQNASDVALRGLQAARTTGLESWYLATILACNASEALLARGRTAEAAAVIDPLTTGPPDRDHWVAHEARAEIDLLRGDVEAALQRRQQIKSCAGNIGSINTARETAQRGGELALWAGRPGDAVDEVAQVLARFKAPDLTLFCGPLLAAGMHACADLAERARARRDESATAAALAAAADLASWADRMDSVPFSDHPFMATIPAERATWDAERTRLAGESDPAAWGAAAKTWDGLGCPHRAGYAWWRLAQAQLDTGQPTAVATTALQTAAAAAEGHAPLLAQIHTLAKRARIPLQARPAAHKPAPGVPAPYGLTERELAVLRLIGAGRTNAQIGAELYMSPRTAGVHVTNILRKLGVTSRVQAAAMAERAGLLDTQT